MRLFKARGSATGGTGSRAEEKENARLKKLVPADFQWLKATLNCMGMDDAKTLAGLRKAVALFPKEDRGNALRILPVFSSADNAAKIKDVAASSSRISPVDRLYFLYRVAEEVRSGKTAGEAVKNAEESTKSGSRFRKMDSLTEEKYFGEACGFSPAYFKNATMLRGICKMNVEMLGEQKTVYVKSMHGKDKTGFLTGNRLAYCLENNTVYSFFKLEPGMKIVPLKNWTAWKLPDHGLHGLISEMERLDRKQIR